MKILLTLLSILLVTGSSFASNWVSIGEGHYIDADSVKPANNYGTYTISTKYLANEVPLEVIKGRDIWTIKTQSFVDCSSNYAKTITYSAYDRKGYLVTTGRNVWKQWYDINNPGSRAYESYAFVCTDQFMKSKTKYDSLLKY